MKSQIICGDNVKVLASLPEKSVQMCVTSPPYWGLRDYGNDKQLGLESTPELYVENLVKVFRGVKRVLRDDGTLWLNLGDSYCGGGRAGNNPDYMAEHKTFGKTRTDVGRYGKPSKIPPGLKPKDLVGIPWRVAFALQKDGWYLRSEIIWHKTAPMPESCTDRCTRAHEQIFLLTKKPHYFYDSFAVSEETVGPKRTRRFSSAAGCSARKLGDSDSGEHRYWTDNGRRNKRSVWSIATKTYRGAHFACVDDKTECLTAGGWKRYAELEVGEAIAAYDIKSQKCEFVLLDDIAVYDVKLQQMVKLYGRSIDQLLTPNHRCVVQRRSGVELIVNADKLKGTHKMLVAAPWNETVDNSKTMPSRLASLIGWYVTEGHAGKDCITLYQSGDANPKYCGEIRGLLNDEGAEYYEASRIRRWRGRNTEAISWRVVGAVANTLLSVCPYRRLPKDFLLWPDSSLVHLWNSLMKGDGHFRSAGRNTFVQKDKVLIDQVQALATRLGFSTTLSWRSEGTWALYKTISQTRQLRSESTELLSSVLYSGTVWCPKTKHGTFIARRNGRVFITGNTYTEKLVEPCIVAGTSEKGSCSVCGEPWVRQLQKVGSSDTTRESRGTKRPQVGPDDDSGFNSGFKADGFVRTVGWKRDCNCEGRETIPCTVLDPFNGAATTSLVARSLGRRYLGIELSTEYCEIANKRLSYDADIITATEEIKSSDFADLLI